MLRCPKITRLKVLQRREGRWVGVFFKKRRKDVLRGNMDVESSPKYLENFAKEMQLLTIDMDSFLL